MMEWCCVNELQTIDKIQKVHKTQSEQNNKPLLQMGFQLNLLSKTVLHIYELDLIYLAGVQWLSLQLDFALKAVLPKKRNKKPELGCFSFRENSLIIFIIKKFMWHFCRNLWKQFKNSLRNKH